MLRRLLIALFLFACGAPMDYDEYVELGQTTEEMSAVRYAGWRNEDNWDHRRCDMHNVNHVCTFPAARTNDPNKWLRRLKPDTDGLVLEPNVTLSTARSIAQQYTMLHTNFWVERTSSDSDADMRIMRDEAIYNGTPPNASLLLSAVVQISCNQESMILVEAWNAQAFACKRHVARVDVGSIDTWMDQWATTANQKQLVWASIYLHIMGVSVGLGAHDAGDTAMRRTLSRAQSPVTWTSYEKCMVNSINFEDPAFVDPNLGIYTNNCSS